MLKKDLSYFWADVHKQILHYITLPVPLRMYSLFKFIFLHFLQIFHIYFTYSCFNNRISLAPNLCYFSPVLVSLTYLQLLADNVCPTQLLLSNCMLACIQPVYQSSWIHSFYIFKSPQPPLPEQWLHSFTVRMLDLAHFSVFGLRATPAQVRYLEERFAVVLLHMQLEEGQHRQFQTSMSQLSSHCLVE